MIGAQEFGEFKRKARLAARKVTPKQALPKTASCSIKEKSLKLNYFRNLEKS
jgi:hypothetical protein